MAMIQFKCSSLLCFCILLISSISNARNLEEGSTPTLGIKAVSLGGWLVTEGWMYLSFFDGIVNNDLLDGTKIQLQSVTAKTYLAAELGGGSTIVANRTVARDWETFRLWRVDASTFQFRVNNGKFMGVNGNDVVAVADTPEKTETFQIERNEKRVRIKAENGKYLQVTTEKAVTADAPGGGGWGDDDPTVFTITNDTKLRGEYQVTNGYGPKAQQMMQKHWNEFIVEEDFKFIKDSGLNAVRIPVGWWIMHDKTPPPPYVGGSLNALDNAFIWANKYKLKVIVDLHAAKGSQNHDDHSSSRDGSLEWGMTDKSIQDAVDVIDFLAVRYANDPCLYAVDLLNEPRKEGVSPEKLSKYYRAGYDAVRKHSKEAYVVMSTLIGASPRDLFDVTAGMEKGVIDVHYYNLFDPTFYGQTAEYNIRFVYENRGKEIDELIKDGRLIFVGEWSAAWYVNDASKKDHQRYAMAQVDVFGKATFGWGYWTFKKEQGDDWSMKTMINEGIIKL